MDLHSKKLLPQKKKRKKKKEEETMTDQNAPRVTMIPFSMVCLPLFPYLLNQRFLAKTTSQKPLSF